MIRIRNIGSTTIVSTPEWSGETFREPTARAYWDELPAPLRTLAVAELAAGNTATQILRNHERGIVLLEFATGPITGLPGPTLVVHTSHSTGNYCYDGTRCTIEDPATGCFLAFIDPAWAETI